MSINLFNKILIIALVLLIINTIIPLKVNAVSDMFKSADDFLEKGDSPTTVIDETKLKETSGTIYKWLMIVAICVAVIIGAIIGVQFITGSVEGRAKIQEALVPYIVGCAVVFGAFFIWKTVVNIGNSLEGETNPAIAASDLTVKIGTGEVKVTDLTDEQLRQLWSNNRIDTNIADKVKGTNSDPRSGGKGTPGVSIDEAINQLGSEAKTIYKECERRGMVEKYKSSYYDNGNKVTKEFVKLKD